MTDATLAALLDGYSGAWRSNEPERLAGFWAPRRFVLYKAEEIATFFTSFDEVVDYWRHNQGFNERVELGFDSPAWRTLEGDVGIATVAMRWDIRFKQNARYMDGRAFPYGGQSMGGDNQVLILTAGAGEALRLIGWSETPDAPLAYMARLYRGNVSPGFGE